MGADRRVMPVPAALAGERIDTVLSRMLGFSRTQASDLIRQGAVSIDGITARKSERVNASSLISVEVPRPRTIRPPVVGMDILYDDDDIVVVDKPVGVAAHAGPGWEGPTVVGNLEAAGFRISSSGPIERQGIVHRLDVGTTGAMMVAKSELAYATMKDAFRKRLVEKTYHALVTGHPEPNRGTIDAPIGRHPSREWRMAVIDGGKPSITHYDTVELLPGAALLELNLETGRTHQIRVHLAAIHHPCLGDTFYGADARQAAELHLGRQWLHAVGLGFHHPRTGEYINVYSPYANDLQYALDSMRHV